MKNYNRVKRAAIIRANSVERQTFCEDSLDKDEKRNAGVGKLGESV